MSICSQYNSYGSCSLLGVSLSECFETPILDKNISSLDYSGLITYSLAVEGVTPPSFPQCIF